jgi:hypothetical protein
MLVLLAVALMGSSVAFAGSGFEGTFKVLKITGTTGSWAKFWIRPDVTQLEQIVFEEDSHNLYVGLQDAKGLTWSANYGVCEGAPAPYCNAMKSADGKTLEMKFWGDMTWFVVTIGEHQGTLRWDSDNGPVTMSFDVVKK